MTDTTAPQARPVDGRTLPTKARGARPTYFDDGGATDAVVAIVTSLAAEVWALRERIDSLEAVLEAADVIEAEAVDDFRADGDRVEGRARGAAEFTARVFRVFEEMREEIVAGETPEAYRSLVDRAFDEQRDQRDQRSDEVGR